MKLRNVIKEIPILNYVAKAAYFLVVEPLKQFPGSHYYWATRYKNGGTSGGGSYGALARHKAETVNDLISTYAVEDVLEFGCGDGNQLALLEVPDYTGVDISKEAIALCKNRFNSDRNKKFFLQSDLDNEIADMPLSMDVIYHLTEEEVFNGYMQRLFSNARRLVVIYSSNTNRQHLLQGQHIRHRQFTTWVENFQPKWALTRHIPNKYPYRGNDRTGSFADFFVYEKVT